MPVLGVIRWMSFDLTGTPHWQHRCRIMRVPWCKWYNVDINRVLRMCEVVHLEGDFREDFSNNKLENFMHAGDVFWSNPSLFSHLQLFTPVSLPLLPQFHALCFEDHWVCKDTGPPARTWVAHQRPYHWRKVNFPTSSSCQLLLAPQLGVGFCHPPPSWEFD